ncbi:MAG: FMN-binding negative transcriptional regulator, partial [Pseudomonadota bacterium]
MYLQAAFREDDLAAMHAAMRATNLMTLVTQGADGLQASHVPILLDDTKGDQGTLTGHLSRANEQWRKTDTDLPALAMFQGPDAYVSPGWYATKREHGKVVPTWNYVAVHAHGSIRFLDDRETLRDIVTALTDRHEAGRAEPWAVTDAPDDYVNAMLNSIVGFEFAIERLEGKWKMSQNRNEADRRGVVDGLKEVGCSGELNVAD